MKKLLLFGFIFSFSNLFSQNSIISKDTIKTTDSISFIAKLEIENTTKDGIFINDYIVNIDFERAKNLNGKIIKVTGKFTYLNGLNNVQSDVDSDSQVLFKQGRKNTIKYIDAPIIEIVKDY